MPKRAEKIENPKLDNPHLRTRFQWIGYQVLRRFTQVCLLVFYRIRVFGRNHIPATGSALICSNHQSHLDPLLVGHCSNRRMNYLARKSLFKSKLFAWVIDFLDAIPLDKDGMGIGGIKETMKRLKRGEMVLIFPEGSRTHDGEFGKFHGGFIVLARRTKSPLLPVGMDGAFHAWPRTRAYPLPGKIAISIGQPIAFEEYKDMDDEEVVALLRKRIETEFLAARRMVGFKSAKPKRVAAAANSA